MLSPKNQRTMKTVQIFEISFEVKKREKPNNAGTLQRGKTGAKWRAWLGLQMVMEMDGEKWLALLLK